MKSYSQLLSALFVYTYAPGTAGFDFSVSLSLSSETSRSLTLLKRRFSTLITVRLQNKSKLTLVERRKSAAEVVAVVVAVVAQSAAVNHLLVALGYCLTA